MAAALEDDFHGLADIDANKGTFGVDDSFTSLTFSPIFTANHQLRSTISRGNLHLFGNIDDNNATAKFDIQIDALVCGITFANIIA